MSNRRKADLVNAQRQYERLKNAAEIFRAAGPCASRTSTPPRLRCKSP